MSTKELNELADLVIKGIAIGRTINKQTGQTQQNVETRSNVDELDKRYVLKKKPSVPILKVAIAEQRREHDELTNAKQHVAIKTLTLSGAGLATLTYLYADGNLFIPSELYGRVFYLAGAVMLIGAVGVLLYATKPSGQWELAPELDKLNDLRETDEAKYLEYVKDRYVTCYAANSRHYHKKQHLMNASFYPLVFGAIILITIKIFGGGQI